MKPARRLRLSRTHRALGLIASVPIVGWIASSFVLHGVGLALPNGLQGVYELEPYHAEAAASLLDPSLVSPAAVQETLARDGIDRIYWLRLELLGGEPAYTVKPGPNELERVYDARTGARIDPLPDARLRAVADRELVGTVSAEMHNAPEFNRYYTVDRVPAVALRMTGDQPNELVLSRTGRTLRRTDPMAEWFHRAYLSVHVWQWGDSLRLFTAVLYGLVGVALTLVSLGYFLWWDRREARRRWSDAVRPERRIHARFAPVAGLFLATQMLVGAYLWFNLGLIEPRFRGQGSFDPDWSGGISVVESLEPASRIEAALTSAGRRPDRRIQRYEWRGIGDHRFWLAYPQRDDDGILVDAGTGTLLDRLPPELARVAGEGVVNGLAVGDGAEATEYWMDFNRRVPTYRFRFTDPDETDVHVSQSSGEVVQRRPAVWRAFGPFLSYHTFGFTGNPWFDTLLLTILQLTILTMVVTGLRMALRGRT